MQSKQTDPQTAPIFLKLGGSLITDKRLAETPRLDVIQRLAAEIAEVRRQNPTLRLVIGHGSGSFGHVHAKQHGTRNGVATPEQWHGFALTADAAARLNRIMVNALLVAGIPAWSIQPSAALRCVDGRIQDGSLDQVVQQALQRGLVPLVYGDTVLDEGRGGTIASTEEIFEWLAPRLHPQRLVLAGEVDGIYTADPQLDPGAKKLPAVTPTMLHAIQAGLGASHGVDVTGGMAAKVVQAIKMVNQQPGREVIICSGLIAGHVQKALSETQAPSAGRVGTRVYGDSLQTNER
ncbi:MAG: isopentenyl phosphate kinase [Caldilineaceae bacterium]